MTATVDAHALVSAARDLIRDDDSATAGLWPRAAALLARQGLELALARLWEVTAPGLERTSTRCQLLCAGDMLNDRALGGRTALTWHSLSNACHHRVYELPPTASELNMALETVWDLAEAVERLRGRMRA
ncbi:MAG TPA: hypothetical protein VJ996_07360 [Solirubrobacteraceae bacterium]|nr:hypothetical protein [Solirubrobacteraceae bacterium]